VRQARAKPLLGQLKQWMEQSLRSLSTKSETAGAIRYSLSHWKALTRYLDDGLLEIDNSAAERALRAVALGRKNYLFCGSDSGGHRTAAIYSLVGSAKLNGLDRELISSPGPDPDPRTPHQPHRRITPMENRPHGCHASHFTS
jgi:transposase